MGHTKVWTNGFYGENEDFVPDLCEGVTIAFSTSTNTNTGHDILVALSTDMLKTFKQCLGDANGDMTDNVEVENWDHGTASTPHLNHHNTPLKKSNTFFCKQGDLIHQDGTCDKSDPPGFYVAIYLQNSEFVVMGRPSKSYVSSTLFHVYTTTGRFQVVDTSVHSFNSWNTDGTVDKTNLLTNKFFTHGSSSRDGLDCETNSGSECLEKGDYMMMFTTGATYAGSSLPLNAAQLAANPIYPQIYQVKKISKEPIPVANFAASDEATNDYSTNLLTPSFVRDQVVLDKVINAEFSLDTETAASDTSAMSFKFYPPTNAYKYAGQCSQRGICDAASGECQCFAGFDGDSCQRIDALAAR